MAEEKKVKTGGAALTGREISEITELVKKFWIAYGQYHDVSEWNQDPEGRRVLAYFQSERRNDALFERSIEYRKCAAKYQQERSSESNEYDESMVAFDRITDPYGIWFYINLSGLPKFLVSETNKHTMGYVVDKWFGGLSIGDIVKEAEKMVGKQQGKKPEGEGADKDPKEDKKEPEDNKKKEKGSFILRFLKQKSKGDEKDQNTTEQIVENEGTKTDEQEVSVDEQHHEADDHAQEVSVDEQHHEADDHAQEVSVDEQHNEGDGQTQEISEEKNQPEGEGVSQESHTDESQYEESDRARS